jgi:anti-sigma factor RsiW
MNPSDSDNPLITRYALSDLSPGEHPVVQDWIESHPQLRDEVAEIQHLAETLRTTSPLHDLHLTSSQRRRVLQPPLQKPVSSPTRLTPSHRSSNSHSFMGSILRIAALLTLSFAAYWLGTQSQEQDPPTTVSTTPPQADTTPPKAPAEHRIPADLPPAPVAVDPSKAIVSTLPQQPAAAPVQPTLAKAPVVPLEEPPKNAFAKFPSFGLATAKANAPFINASKTPGDNTVVYPRRLRQPIAQSATQLEAKPLDPSASGTPRKESPAHKKPGLYIHSWRSEVAACPWDSNLRLLRVNLQLPADQEAVQIGDSDYPLEIVFDPNNVRQFRRLGTRHIPSKELRSAGTQVVWYEFQPNGSPANSHETGKHIATVRLPSARFTTQTVGPFDGSSLQVLDRGQDWRTAREDFRFETAMLGLGILLDGGLPGGKLNHQLLLEVAETTPSKDPEDSRTRLVQALRQLATWTGR